MAARANWRGFLRLAELTCPVGLFTAVSTADRVSFHTINRRTGNRVQRQFVDRDTGGVVERDDQVKGYEVSPGRYVVLEPEEVAAAVPESDKMLDIGDFIPCGQIDDVFFDRPYYLAPGPGVDEVFDLLRAGMAAKKVAALARTVLFRRVRTLLIRPHEAGMIATTLSYDYEVRSSREAFRDIPARKIGGEMLELAEHIIATKKGRFDPAAFDDRYEAALAELVRAKIEGRDLPKAKPRRAGKVVDLMEALRLSAGQGGTAAKGGKKAARPKAAAQAERKNGAKTGAADERPAGTKAEVRPRPSRAGAAAKAAPRRKAG
ncbi:Ku protein [Ancylobacter sp. 6x-1]|uniref:Non-homologous end joining protein Ku n=1 Tax=Ancylobacter crimeensis TaxID=2579147 RepID=A0ABT0DAY8_9HYPH|nr:Ku protein [Ancylobacter crimeensis]MCK0197128.1 Ku protein [Ancylobacter crimeensis]